ncbi:MAG: cysteine--tRNA ligase [Firmicutes bacterium]|nr:cysteine--tRNA ligase [Candidatus Fiminaster equi]
MKVFNSLSNQVEVLKPIRENEVSIYCCGPTVYGDAHVGNIRPVIVFDTLRRFLEYVGYNVKLVSNFTDVDDKIIKRAVEEGVSESVITDRYIKAYKDVLSKINVKEHFKNPRVTEYMGFIISYIDDLVKAGAAYEIDGDVFFRISSISDYGELSNVKIDDLVVGARIEENSKKESPLDFCLWKKTDVGIQWDSPWGKGRPGWHTECCVMINSIFNGKIDIHGGGFDLKFPHHENEIAQAKAHDHNKIANVWMHNGFVNFGNEKMSKSLGNVVLAKDAIEKYGGNTMRLLILETHYRAPVSFTEETIQSTKNELDKIQKAYNQLAVAIQVHHGDLKSGTPEVADFVSAMADDLNTSNALAALFEKVKQANVEMRKNPQNLQEISNIFASLNVMLDILGIKLDAPILTPELEGIYKEYLRLKSEKKFEESDKLRNVLIENKII